jgi:hypothetical protein
MYERKAIRGGVWRTCPSSSLFDARKHYSVMDCLFYGTNPKESKKTLDMHLGTVIVGLNLRSGGQISLDCRGV